jgi:sarcosine oxidase subunit delta
MRIPCPFCGDRDASEFTYLGDAALARRPAPEATEAFADYVYLRDNPVGLHHELWYHAAGCRHWLRVARDTRTHAVSGAEVARKIPGSEPS